MLLDPVGASDIAKRANVAPDTVKKWIGRHDTFPTHRGNPSGRRVWEWADVDRWLRMTGRKPSAIRYCGYGSDAVIKAEVQDEGDRWTAVAYFAGSSDTSWDARPTQAGIDQVGGDVSAARMCAFRLLQGWEEARERWLRAHPDELMPQHLIGAMDYEYRALHGGSDTDAKQSPPTEPDLVEAPEDPVVNALRAERQRVVARLAEIDARLRSS